jgi:peroxiredoxin
MEYVILIARLVLAAVFVVAAVSKLADSDGTRQGLRDFGVPDALSAPLGFLLPLAELAVAVALLPTTTAWFAATAALALLLVFTAAIALNLVRGHRPDCHCFGQVASGKIGVSTLLRNAVLAAVAAFVIWQGQHNPGPSVVAWLGDLTIAEGIGLGLGAAVLALLSLEVWMLLQLVSQNGRLLSRLESVEAQIAGLAAADGGAVPAPVPSATPAVGLAVGSPAPGFSLTGLYGETLTLDALRAAGKPLLLAFTDPGCGPCQALLPDLARWQRELAGTLNVVLISRGNVDDNRAKSSEHGLTQVLLQLDREVMNAYQCYGTPGAVLVRPDGSIGSSVAQGAEEIRALVARSASGALAAPLPLAVYPPPANGSGPCPHCGQYHDQQAPAAAAPAMPQGLAIGSPAPALKLPDLTGKEVDLADFRGRETVLLFWNTGCGFCQQMLPQLKDWESNRPSGAPALLLVAAGGADANKAQGLMSTVLLDDAFTAGAAFGASGTPSAIKVGSDGAIAAPLAVGAPGVMALLTGQPVAAQPATPAPPAVRVGDPAPEFTLPDLDGKNVALADYKGKRTLLLFWNPGCGFCQQMLQDLRTWEVHRPADAPEVLVISTGAAQENRVMGLRSRMLLDSGLSVGQRYGALGTPMAVMVDAEGRVASEVGTGAQAVLALARGA